MVMYASRCTLIMPLSLAICSSANNPFFAKVIEGVVRTTSDNAEARLLTWQGNHVVPPAALPYLHPDALILGAITAPDAAALPGQLPKIGFSNSQQKSFWPRVVNDDFEVGAFATQALLDAGYQTISIFGALQMHHYRLRANGAISATRKAGVPYQLIDTSLPPPAEGESFAQVWTKQQNGLRKSLTSLPPNSGLVVLVGNLANELNHLLREEVKREIPGDIGLIVADLVSPENRELAHIGLPGEKIGEVCAESLLRHLREPGWALPEIQTIPPSELHPGQTIRTEEGQLLHQRLESWCRKHLREAVTVEHAAAELGFSRRSLEMKLHAQGLPSPYELLTKIRLAEACRLLAGSTLRLSEIAEATGFQTTRALSNRFRAHHSTSPRKWRDRQNRNK